MNFKDICNPRCTNCKKLYDGQTISDSIGMNEPHEIKCECGKYIKVTNEVSVKWQLRYTSAYDKGKVDNDDRQ